MRVLLECETEMPDVGLLIHRLRERSDYQPFEQQSVGPRGQAFDQLPKLARCRLLGELRVDLQRGQHLLQLSDTLILRLAVYPVQTFGFRGAQRHRGFHIGGDHALLDQAMRVVARDGIKSLDGALLADARLDLAAAEIQRAARIARMLECAVHGIQSLQRCAHGRRHIACMLLGILQIAPRLIVGQARVRDDDRLVESRLAQFAGLAHMHVADECQSLHARHERAEMIRQIFRQHGYHPIRKVHRGGARPRFQVQRRAVAHVIADVRDRDNQAPTAAGLRLGVHGVVEIARILAIDGHERQIAQVDAPFYIVGRYVRRKAICLLQNIGRKFLRQIVS